MFNVELVLAAVGREFRVERSELLAPTRSRKNIAWARQVAMYLLHTSGMSYTGVGRIFNRDRTTVRHACARVEDLRGQGDDLDLSLLEIERACAAALV